LVQNYPNPFIFLTIIQFKLPAAAQVELAVYNMRGEKVRTLVDQLCPVSLHSIRWDGFDDSGRQLASGIYVCILKCQGRMDVKKLVLIK
jgi:flagellar hook assembly protein FlgD